MHRFNEGHHVPASTFTSIIDGSHARYKIGLSGTMIRKDGKHVFFRDYFGSTVYKPAQNNTVNPTIKFTPFLISIFYFYFIIYLSFFLYFFYILSFW